MRLLQIVAITFLSTVVLGCDSEQLALIGQGVIESVTPGTGGGGVSLLLDQFSGGGCDVKVEIGVNGDTELRYADGGSADQSALVVGRSVAVYQGPGTAWLDRCPPETVAARVVLNQVTTQP